MRIIGIDPGTAIVGYGIVDFENGEFSFSTPVGKWKIDTTAKPYVIYHINLVMTPQASSYHRQPRIFLSMLDCMAYIRRHDDELCERTIGSRQDPAACKAAGL